MFELITLNGSAQEFKYKAKIKWSVMGRLYFLQPIYLLNLLILIYSKAPPPKKQKQKNSEPIKGVSM